MPNWQGTGRSLSSVLSPQDVLNFSNQDSVELKGAHSVRSTMLPYQKGTMLPQGKDLVYSPQRHYTQFGELQTPPSVHVSGLTFSVTPLSCTPLSPQSIPPEGTLVDCGGGC